jgi:hypothetical protein
MSAVPEAEEFEALLGQTLVPDSAVIAHAEAVLKQIVKSPGSVAALLMQMTQSENPGVRQVAAVQLRKSVAKHWTKLDEESQGQLKAMMLDRIVNEEHHLVRKGAANVVSAMAKKAFVGAAGWPELLDFLVQCTQSPNADHREVGLMVFEALSALAGEHLKPHLANLQQIFLQSLADVEARVRVAGLRAACQLVQWLEPAEVAAFSEIVPPMANVVRQCLEDGDEDNGCLAIEVFHELIDCPVSVLTPHLAAIVQFSLEVGSNTELRVNTRQMALEMVVALAESKTKFFKQTAGVTDHIIGALFPIMAERTVDETATDDEQASAYKMGANCLDSLANALPSKMTFQPAMALAAEYSHSDDAFARRAALIATGVLAEGCADAMRTTLTELSSFVSSGASDVDPIVRDASCFAIGQFAEYLQPDIIDYHATILPAVFSCLDDATDLVKEKSALALESFCENMEKEILPYLEPLMTKLMELLMAGAPQVQESAIAAISSTTAAVITAAQSGECEFAVFRPFADGVMPVFKHIMTATEEEMLVIRARATECVGIVIQCYEPETAMQHISEFLPLAMQGLQLDSSELREFTYGCFANIAEMMKEDFAPFLPAVMETIFKSMEENDIKWDDSEDGSDTDLEEDSGDDSDDDNPFSLMPGKGFSVRTAFLDEKASACMCCGNIADNVTAPVFAPFIERSMELLIDLSDYFHEDIKGSARTSLGYILNAVHELYPPDASTGALHPTTAEVNKRVLEVFRDTLISEPDKMVVARTCSVLSMMTGVHVDKFCNHMHLCILCVYILCRNIGDPSVGGVNRVDYSAIRVARAGHVSAGGRSDPGTLVVVLCIERRLKTVF